MAKSHQVCQFYNLHDSSLGCHVNAGSHKSSLKLNLTVFLSHSVENENLYTKLFFSGAP